jgi:UvrD-like helicase family protein
MKQAVRARDAVAPCPARANKPCPRIPYRPLASSQIRQKEEKRSRGAVIYGFEELDTLVPAYAATIHKSQGSEYPAVIIPVMMAHYAMLRRNLLYTGITRGKKLAVRSVRRRLSPSGRRRWSASTEEIWQSYNGEGEWRISRIYRYRLCQVQPLLPSGSPHRLRGPPRPAKKNRPLGVQ